MSTKRLRQPLRPYATEVVDSHHVSPHVDEHSGSLTREALRATYGKQKERAFTTEFELR